MSRSLTADPLRRSPRLRRGDARLGHDRPHPRRGLPPLAGDGDAAQLTDVHGPRLSGSPQYKEAAEWARQQLEDWGLDERAPRELRPFGRGWSFERCSAHVVAPRDVPAGRDPEGLDRGHERRRCAARWCGSRSRPRPTSRSGRASWRASWSGPASRASSSRRRTRRLPALQREGARRARGVPDARPARRARRRGRPAVRPRGVPAAAPHQPGAREALRRREAARRRRALGARRQRAAARRAAARARRATPGGDRSSSSPPSTGTASRASSTASSRSRSSST